MVLLSYLATMQILSIRQESVTADEPLELAAGYSYLKTGDFRLNPEHPPLAKILAALPLLAFKPTLPLASPAWSEPDEAAFGLEFFQANRVKAYRMLFAARLSSIVLTACLGLAMAFWTRANFGPAAAVLALLFYAFDPTVTAYGRYVKNDIALTLFAFLASIAWGAFLKHPSATRFLLAALALGLAFATKFSALFLIPVLAILFAIRYWQGSLGLSLRHGILSTIGVVTLAGLATYFVYSVFSLGHGVALGGFDRRVFRDLLDRNQTAALARILSPAHLRVHPFLAGLLLMVDNNTLGHVNYLLGMQNTAGWWYYFPAAFAVKTPVATLVFFALAGFGVYQRLRRARLRSASFSWFVLAVPLLVFLPFSMASHLNIGIRHLLPIWPFVFIIAAATFTDMRFRGRRAMLVVLGAGLLAESLSIYPHYLAFFNLLAGGPNNGPTILLDSNIDWGQDAKKLSAWIHAHRISNVCLDYWGNADLGALGLRGASLPATWEIDQRQALDCVGAISVNLLYDLSEDPNKHAWLRARRPVARIGYSIYIYDLRKKSIEN